MFYTNDGPVTISEHLYDPKRQFYVAQLNEALALGQLYLLKMEFVGFLNDDLKGFYRSSYKDEFGTTRFERFVGNNALVMLLIKLLEGILLYC